MCIHVKKQQLEMDMEQRTGSKLGKDMKVKQPARGLEQSGAPSG